MGVGRIFEPDCSSRVVQVKSIIVFFIYVIAALYWQDHPFTSWNWKHISIELWKNDRERERKRDWVRDKRRERGERGRLKVDLIWNSI